MKPAHFLPANSLRPHIACYGIIDMAPDRQASYVFPPLGLCGFIFSLRGEIDATTKGELLMKGKYCAAGQITSPVTGAIRGGDKIVVVFMQPCGMHHFFGTDMSSLTNTTLPLDQLLGEERTAGLAHQLEMARDHATIISILDLFFCSCSAAATIELRILHAIQFIQQQRGNVTICDIERNCFISQRSLERYFKLYTGLSPKDYVKIYRFKCLMKFMQTHPRVNWNTLCLENGYYDQAHLTRYFTRFLKASPSKLLDGEMEYIDYLLHA